MAPRDQAAATVSFKGVRGRRVDGIQPLGVLVLAPAPVPCTVGSSLVPFSITCRLFLAGTPRTPAEPWSPPSGLAAARPSGSLQLRCFPIHKRKRRLWAVPAGGRRRG